MNDIGWTILEEESFASELEAYKFINTLKLLTSAHYGLNPKPCDTYLEFKVSKRGNKFYIWYKLL